jgi:DNA-binding transcriptional LysR family regulator
MQAVAPIRAIEIGARRTRQGRDGSFEEYIAPQIASGALMRVLEDWCPPFAGYFLYYPSRRQQPASLSALIETLRL